MRVLGIETSCDETGAAIYDSERGLLSHGLYTQVALHREFGGVVPELAARDHIRKLLPLVRTVMRDSGAQAGDIGGVAYTAGPGLVGALLVGASFGRSLARTWGVPALGVHHMEGHLMAPMLEPEPPSFPFVALLVSGGHTLLVDVEGLGKYRVLGESRDDAVGEAFDKVAKLLGLGYPGGPAVARAAEDGDPRRFQFPRPMTDRPGLDFSFSGLKTFVRNTVLAHTLEPQTVADIACAFQEAAVDTLVIKCRRALRQTGRKRLVVAGGVGANALLRKRLGEEVELLAARAFYPRPEWCTDNAAMIAYLGCRRILAGEHDPLRIAVRARWSLRELGEAKV